MTVKPGFQKFCIIKNHGNDYIFQNIRDFDWTSLGLDQKQNWISDSFDIRKLSGLYLYVSPFAFYNRVGHTILEFRFVGGKKLYLSVEGQQNLGEEYSLFKAIYPGYRLRYLWGTYRDTIGLRFFRKDKLFSYPLYLSKKNIQNLFVDLVEQTNISSKTNEDYGLIFNNCTSALWMAAKRHIKDLPKRHIGFIFNKFLPRFLHNLGILKLSDRKFIKKFK